LAWRASEESFIKNLNVFTDLKFRVGYGISGNSLGFDPFISSVLYTKKGQFYNNGSYISAIGANRNANPDLKWERTSMFNVGVDFGFFNNRLTGSIEYYNKTTKDLIADYAVPSTKYLVSWLTANVGEINNKGIEFSLNAIPVQTKDFTWNTTLNVSHNKNKVVSISNESFTADYFDEAELNAPGQSGAQQQRITAGRPLGSFYMWKWAGYDTNGLSTFYTADGKTTTQPTNADRQWLGDAQPKLVFGWNNTLTYKNWSMTMFFTGMTGNKILNATRARLSRLADVTRVNILANVLDDNKSTDTNSHLLCDRYLEKGDFIRLQTLSVAYNFKKFCDFIQNLRVYASCNNVFVITGYKGLDPEVNLGGLTPGIDNKNFYPKTRTFMIGASITF
jgi:iron complex outermembrane receptor protein